MRLSPAILSALFALLVRWPVAAGADEPRSLVLPPPRSALEDMTADGRPTPAGVALLRSHARGRLARLTVDGDRFLVGDLRFDSLGVAFADVPRADLRPRGERGTVPDSVGVVSSPVAWSAIGGIETRHSNVLPGIIAGAVVLTFAGMGVGHAVVDEPDAAAIVIFLALPPAGAVIGGLVGARFPRWQHEWPPRNRPRRGDR